MINTYKIFRLCTACGDHNYSKRNDRISLTGKVAIVTGARVKIGYHTTLKLLRCGATVVATTRFVNDAVNRFMKVGIDHHALILTLPRNLILRFGRATFISSNLTWLLWAKFHCLHKRLLPCSIPSIYWSIMLLRQFIGIHLHIHPHNYWASLIFIRPEYVYAKLKAKEEEGPIEYITWNGTAAECNQGMACKGDLWLSFHFSTSSLWTTSWGLLYDNFGWIWRWQEGKE